MNEEYELYKRMWTSGYRKSQCAIPLISFIEKECLQTDRMIEIGSGEGTTIRGLKAKGYEVIGTDIYSTREDIVECPAWALPFGDESFDVSFSTDVLEHLPTESVDDAIKEILRVTKRKSIHVIACWGDVRNGEVLHKTVMPIKWWQEKFAQLNTQGKELIVIDRDRFL